MNPIDKSTLKESFKSAANSLAEFYKHTISLQKASYTAGQRDALNLIAQFAINETNGNVSNLTTTGLLKFIESQINELETDHDFPRSMPLQNQTQNHTFFETQPQPQSNLPTPIREAFYQDDLLTNRIEKQEKFIEILGSQTHLTKQAPDTDFRNDNVYNTFWQNESKTRKNFQGNQY